MATKPTDAVYKACDVLLMKLDIMVEECQKFDRPPPADYVKEYIRPLIIGIQTGDTKSLQQLTRGM